MLRDRVDDLARLLASTTNRRALLRSMAASGIAGAVVAARPGGARSRPAAANDKVVVCVWHAGEGYTPKLLPSPAAETFVAHGKALYPIQTSDDYCAFPCGPQCLSCPQRLPSHVCTLCVDGACVCPPSAIWVTSLQGGVGGTAPLLGTKYQVFNYDESTLTIGGTPLSGVEEATDATGIVVFDGFPGDSSACVKEVETPAGYAVVGFDFACLHLGCGHEFVWPFYHEP